MTDTTTLERLERMREFHKEIVEGDNGECEMMANWRWMCDQIERQHYALHVIASCRPGTSGLVYGTLEQLIDTMCIRAEQALEERDA